MTQMIYGRKLAPRCLGDVCLLGLGVTGCAVMRYLAAQPEGRVSSLTVYPGQGGAEVASQDAPFPVMVMEGDAVAGSYDVCIASPGIPETSGFYRSAKACSKELIGEVELAWRESPADSLWVGVTGTNGKTTTTAMLAQVLDSCGYDALACGNIGSACLDAVVGDLSENACPPQGKRVFVAEVSSYQLASIVDFAPEVGIFLGLTPDHLSWHGSFEAYADAKWKMLVSLERAGGVAVMDATNDVVREQVRRARLAHDGEGGGFAYIPIGTKAGIKGDMREACGALNAAFLDEADHLHLAFDDGEYVLPSADDLQIKGPHNVLNALAAAAGAVALGADAVKVTEALPEFKPLEHRIEPCGEAQGMSFYNDSKATNVDATLMALGSFPDRPLIVMLGGRDKMGPLDELVASCDEHAKCVVLFGEAAERFADAFAGSGVHVVRASGFDDAFKAACDAAESGDVILLSPACASFDEFSCFEERGRHFKELVRKRAQGIL